MKDNQDFTHKFTTLFFLCIDYEIECSELSNNFQFQNLYFKFNNN